MNIIRLAASSLFFFSVCYMVGAKTSFPWQKDYAEVTEAGDIKLIQKPFKFTSGANARYIDYENGSDDNPGTREKPWKHHPWDKNAGGESAALPSMFSGVDTYIFKGGVVYRGQITMREHGRPNNPIRLTRDPSWGEGSAIIAGSELATNFTLGADHPDIPEPEKVWKTELSFSPRSLWLIKKAGESVRIPLARIPNWTSQPEDHKEEWWYWTNEGAHKEEAHWIPPEGWSATDSKNLKDKPREFIEGALIYSEWGWVMGTPYPSPINKFDPETGRVLFQGWNGGQAGGKRGTIIARYMRYYLEDKPHYLDDPNGEYWFDKKGEGGTLYLRLPDGFNPNEAMFEAGRRHELISGEDVRHIEITGLDFRWTTPQWYLPVVAWDFNTKPFSYNREAHPCSIQIWGSAEDVRIANCRFEDVEMGIRMMGVGQGAIIRNITLEDNVFSNAVVGAVHLCSGQQWGFTHTKGVLDDVRVYRNYAANIGFRPGRYQSGLAFDIGHPFRAHIAGNVIERVGAQGINFRGGKPNNMRGDVPLVRILVHQNKVWKSMQNCNDYGGIEGWQHGPMYIYNNLSHDARGLKIDALRMSQNNPDYVHNDAGFGHAYYLDGGYKAYTFNNIAWGLSHDINSKLVNCTAFMEIGFENTYFNNTAYNFSEGSRRQAVAGRDKFAGNVFQNIGAWVFRHHTPQRTKVDLNMADLPDLKDKVDFTSNAFDRNLFHNYNHIAAYLTDGSWIKTSDQFREVLEMTDALASNLGVDDDVQALRDPAQGDFRLTEESAGIDNGAVVFVPWALYGVAAEWHFYHRGGDYTDILDEHWYARDYMGSRNDYHKRPTYPLKGVNIEPEDYMEGPLENFTKGALRLNPARKTYAVLSNAKLNEPYKVTLRTTGGPGTAHNPEELTFAGDDLKTASIHDGNFLIEVYFKAEGDGLLISKKKDAGYDLRVRDGKAVFSVECQNGSKAELISDSVLNDGKWRHLIAEADRSSGTMTLYVDGKRDSIGFGLHNVSIANDADLYVGGMPEGDHLDGTLEFMRVARGTLADACTTIEELYAWQFNGPFLRDMRGAEPKGKGRDAGAVESF